MRIWRAKLTSGEILEGSFKAVYKTSLKWCKQTGASAEIYDTWQMQWSKLNSLTPVPYVSIHSHEGLGVYVITSQGQDLWYR